MRLCKRIIVFLLSLVMVMSSFSTNVFAMDENRSVEEVIFVSQPEQSVYQVIKGTELGNAGLPGEVAAQVRTVNGGDEIVQEERMLAVYWQGTYAAGEVGRYILAAEFKDDFLVAQGVVMPVAEVEVIDNNETKKAESSQDPSLSEDITGEGFKDNFEQNILAEAALTGDAASGEDDVESGIQTLADEGDEEFDPARYSPNEYGMPDWPGYTQFKEFFDAMPPVEEVAKYELKSPEVDKLRADMEKARELAKAVEDFTVMMQDYDLHYSSYSKRVEEDIRYAEEEGWEITEEEKAEYRAGIPVYAENLVQWWKEAQDNLVAGKIIAPMEELFTQYIWYIDRNGDGETVVRNGCAVILLPEGANDDLKTPEDFEIGKRGQETFVIGVTVDFNGFTNVEGLSGKTAIVRLPKGMSFAADSFTESSNGETYKFTPEGNGKQELMITFSDAFTGKFYQTFLIKQNAKDLVNDLQNSKGNLDFALDVFTGYRTASQKQVLSNEDQEHSAVMTFKADASTPEVTVSIEKGNIDDIYYPKTFEGDRSTWAYHDWKLHSDEPVYVVNIEKTEGYLSDDFGIRFNFPGVEEGVFAPDVHIDKMYFTGEDGVKREVAYSYNYVKQKGDMIMFGMGDYANSRSWENDIFRFVEGTDKTFAQTFHEKGTFTVHIDVSAYVNRLYDGDWSKTLYTSSKNIEAYVMNYEKAELYMTQSQSPLYFNFQNGEKAVGYTGTLDGLQAEMPQYGNISRYEDGQWITASGKLEEKQGSDKNFGFYDDLCLSFDFSEELSPIAVQKMKTSKYSGISYRMYITNAVTGAVERIETVVGEEEYPEYAAKTIDGVTETLIDGGSNTAWQLAEADNKDNTLYVSRIEAFREQYEYNCVFEYGYSDWAPMEMKLRAQHHLLSDSSVDVPDNFEAKIKRTMSAASPEIEFTAEYTVKLRHLTDNISLGNNMTCNNFVMEVNEHNESGRYFSYSLIKYADTQKYNTNDDGAEILFGEEGYDPVVVELSGDAITVTDRLEQTGQRVLGVWGDDGNYYDLAENGINADDYLIQTACQISADDFDRELYNINSNHSGSWSNGEKPVHYLYDLASIYEKLGIGYAQKLVVAVSDFNDTNVAAGSNKAEIAFSGAIHDIHPGYLNYDNVIGITSSADRNVKLTGQVKLFCTYSDYLNSERDGNEYTDSIDTENGKNFHGPDNSKKLYPSAITYGSYATKVNYATDSTEYVKPMGHFWEGSRENCYATDLICFEVTPERYNSPQIDYGEVTYDLTGTDPRLLALTNTIFFQGCDTYNVILEYTLSDGTSVMTEKNFEVSKVNSHSALYYTIPELCDKGPYEWDESKPASLTKRHLTSLKITFPDGINWGSNHNKGARNERLPDFGLSMMDVVIPEYYPNDPTQKIGTMAHDDATGLDYDNLKGALSVSFSDSMGNVLANGEGDYHAEGLSKRIGVPRIYVSELRDSVSYERHYWGEATSVYQNEEITVQTCPTLEIRDATNLNDEKVDAERMKQIMDEYGVVLKPTFYYVIDKGFSYVPDSFYISGGYNGTKQVTGVQARYIDTYKDGNGLLIISYDQANGDFYSIQYKEFDFKLRAKYDAAVGTTKPITEVWADVPYNRNLDGSYNIQGQTASVDTANTTAGAPYGENVGNDGKLAPNGSGEYEMLRYDEYKDSYRRPLPTVSVQEKVFTGMLNYVKTYAPEAEDNFKVFAKDILAEENIYGYKSFLTGDTKEPTHDWELYTVIPKKDETFKYFNEDNVLSVSKASDFSLVFNGVDVSKLQEEGVVYKLYYTTDASPASRGYASMKEASWTEFTADTVSAAEAVNITGVKLWIEELQSKQKISLETKYKLEDHKRKTGEETGYVISYVNFKMGTAADHEEALAGGLDGYSDLAPLEYHLEDMNITGYAWIENDYNSRYDQDEDSMYQGVSFKVYDENGNEIEQREEMKGQSTSGQDGRYLLAVPHDGKWQLEASAPSGIGFVNKLVSGNEAVESAFDRNTKKTDIIEFVSDYRALYFTCSNVNVGVCNMPKIDFPELVEIPVGKDDQGDFTVTVENRVPGTVSAIELKNGENEDVTTVKNGGDDTARFDGKTTGKVNGKVSIDDGYGGMVEGEFTVIVYSSVIYDNENTIADSPISKTIGEVPVDVNHYYYSEDEDGNDLYTDLAIVKNDDSFRSSGYAFIGWARSKADAEAGKAEYQPGEQIKLRSCDADLLLYAVWQKCTPAIADPPVAKKITGDKPDKEDQFTFELKAVKNDAGLDTMPMPEAAGQEQSMRKTVLGEGSTEFGNITFTVPGIYEYTITEADEGLTNYTYDTSVYIVRYYVTQEGTALKVARTITKDGAETDTVLFTNTYTKDKPAARDGNGKTGNTDPKTSSRPKTGDTADMFMWITLAAVSAAAITAAVLGRRKKNTKQQSNINS